MKEKRRLCKYALFWTLAGIPIGILHHLILKNLLHMETDFWMTTILTAGYIGYFIGIVGGFFWICHYPEETPQISKIKLKSRKTKEIRKIKPLKNV